MSSWSRIDGYSRSLFSAYVNSGGVGLIKEPSLEDQIRARIKQEGFDQKRPSLLDQMQADPQNIGMARGGIMDINQMIRPIGR